MASERSAGEHLNDGEEHTGPTYEDDPRIEGAGGSLDDDNNSGGGVDSDTEAFLWGYKVQEKLGFPDAHRDKANRLISRFKLLLDNSNYTKKIRDRLTPTIESLKRRKIIEKEENLIADYLTFLFRHVKEELSEEHEFTDDYAIEFVFCVPAIWAQKACRTMGSAMFKSGF